MINEKEYLDLKNNFTNMNSKVNKKIFIYSILVDLILLPIVAVLFYNKLMPLHVFIALSLIILLKTMVLSCIISYTKKYVNFQKTILIKALETSEFNKINSEFIMEYKKLEKFNSDGVFVTKYANMTAKAQIKTEKYSYYYDTYFITSSGSISSTVFSGNIITLNYDKKDTFYLCTKKYVTGKNKLKPYKNYFIKNDDGKDYSKYIEFLDYYKNKLNCKDIYLVSDKGKTVFAYDIKEKPLKLNKFDFKDFNALVDKINANLYIANKLIEL